MSKITRRIERPAPPSAPMEVVKSDPPESDQLLASAIVKVSEGFATLQKSGLNRDAIIALIHDRTKLSKRMIKKVLDALVDLRKWYCK